MTSARAEAVVLPGFNGDARQPLVQAAARALKEAGVAARALSPPKGRPSPGLANEVAWLHEQVEGSASLLLIGRSFGGRVALRYASRYGARGVVLWGFPFRSASGRRPEDEALLAACSVPTLIVQGDRDEKGPLRALRRLVAGRPQVTVEVLARTGHGFGPRALRQALEVTTRFALALPL